MPDVTRRARVYIGLVSFTGALALVPAVFLGVTWVRVHYLEVLGLAALVVLAERFVVHMTFRRETLSFSVVETVATYALAIIPEASFVLAVTFGVLIAQLLRRRPPVKVAFNTAMYALCSGGAALVFHAVAPTFLGGPYQWGAAVIAMAVFYVLNQALVSTVVALVEGQRIRNILSVSMPLMGAIGGGNVSLGLLASYLARSNPPALGFLVVPFLLSYLAYSAWIRSRRDGAKMRSLYETGTTLVTQLTRNDQLVKFLEAARYMFRASSAELVTLGTDGVLTKVGDDGAAERVEGEAARISSYVEINASDSQLTAYLPARSGVPGALIVKDHIGPDGPAPFPAEDATLLQALANEVAVTLSNLELFKSVEQERAKLKDVVESTSDGIYQVSPDRRIITWNPAMERITGFSAEEAVGQMCFSILRARDGRGVDMCSSDCPILAACDTGTTQSRDAEIMNRDGTARWIHYTHSPIVDEVGTVTSDVIVVRDVTAERAIGQAKEDFVATVSHELRTPITPIKGFLLTLMRSDRNFSEEERFDFLERMLRQTERLESLVADLLEVSRLESGLSSTKAEPTEVCTAVRQMVGDFRQSHPERSFKLRLPQTAIAMTDAARLDQVISNLLQNAVRYSPAPTPIEVSVSTDPIAKEINVTVRDHGPGIPYEEHDRIFDRFYRLGDHLTREQGGTGLGLYISQRLVEEMGGRISLISRPGSGSAFTVHLRSTPPAGTSSNGRGGLRVDPLDDQPAPEQADSHR